MYLRYGVRRKGEEGEGEEGGAGSQCLFSLNIDFVCVVFVKGGASFASLTLQIFLHSPFLSSLSPSLPSPIPFLSSSPLI